jgi:hypothetical protein
VIGACIGAYVIFDTYRRAFQIGRDTSVGKFNSEYFHLVKNIRATEVVHFIHPQSLQHTVAKRGSAPPMIHAAPDLPPSTVAPTDLPTPAPVPQLDLEINLPLDEAGFDKWIFRQFGRPATLSDANVSVGNVSNVVLGLVRSTDPENFAIFAHSLRVS